MNYTVSSLIPDCNLEISGVSYIGNPQSNTVMYVSKKVEHLLENLLKVKESLVFAENTIQIPQNLKESNYFVCTDNPQRKYAEFVNQLFKMHFVMERRRKYLLTEEGYYIGENVTLGENAYIEPGCLIGHDVVIGKDACILSGTVIKNAIIGDCFLANEGAVIGAYGFTMTEDESGNKFRIPTLGKVIIGNCVEVGTHDNISCGSGGNTIIEDYVKIDALVHIGHDAHLYNNTEITAGCIVGGFVHARENTYMGINACIKNRISLGKNCVVGMGATVIKAVEEEVTVAGNPARILK